MDLTLDTHKPKIATSKILLWLAIAGMIMMFAGLTSGLVVRQAEGNWITIIVPQAFYFSTAFILLSSVTMQLAVASVKRNNLNSVKTWLIVTLGFGLAFVFCQFLGYNSLVNQGVFFTGGTASGSFFYAITGLHLAHLLGGILSVMYTAGKSIMEKYHSDNYLGIQLCATYWHFLDGLWIYLFLFLSLAG